MEVPAWEQSREKLHHYNRREPTDSALYRILYNYRQEFEYCYEELLQQQYGFLRKEVLEVFDAYLDCGILRHGCARAVCEDCEHSTLIAFSCKKRGVCPSCAAKRAHIFAENLHENVLLPYPHKHVVFTIPIRLRVYFKYDRKLTSILYKAAWKAWSEYLSSQLPDGKPAAVLSLHTSGDLLNWHPHIHGTVLAGAINEDGSFVLFNNIDTAAIEKTFAKYIYAELLYKELIDQDTVENIKSWKHSGFRVWLGEDILSVEDEKRLFISRYLVKAPLALKRMEIVNIQLAPTVRYYKDETKEEFKDFSPLEFLAELSLQIPRKWEQMTRFYGKYSCKTRGAEKRKQKLLSLRQNNFEPLELDDIDKDDTDKKPPSRHWAIWIKKVYEINPLVCPRCQGQMKVKSFIHDSKEISRICNNLGINDWRAPPKLKHSQITSNFS